MPLPQNLSQGDNCSRRISFKLDLICEDYMTDKAFHNVTFHSKITIAGDVVPYCTVTVLVPTLK